MTPREYLDGLLAEIERAKEQGRKGVFRMNAKVSNATISLLKQHFVGNPNYRSDFRPCRRCTGQWDIIIWFYKDK